MKNILIILSLLVSTTLIAQMSGRIPEEYQKYIHRNLSEINVDLDKDMDKSLLRKELDLFACVWGLVPSAAIEFTVDSSTVSFCFYRSNEENWELILEFKDKKPCNIGFVLNASADIDKSIYYQSKIGSVLDEVSRLYYDPIENTSRIYRYPYVLGTGYLEITVEDANMSYEKLLADAKSYILFMVDRNSSDIKNLAKYYRKAKKKAIKDKAKRLKEEKKLKTESE